MGAGYSSLSALVTIEPNYLKFDIALVRGIDRSSIKRSLLETVVDLSGRIGAKVVAEGIEAEGELTTLRDMGVPLGQGRILAEQRGKDYRSEDILCLDKPRGHNFIIFLERKRRRNHPPSMADLKAVRTRMISSLAANLGRAAFPYIKTPPLVEVGYGMAVY